jgi:hypothetical protein
VTCVEVRIEFFVTPVPKRSICHGNITVVKVARSDRVVVARRGVASDGHRLIARRRLSRCSTASRGPTAVLG